MAQLDVSELDFASIKQSLQTYLQAQDEFSDYNFEGSGLSILLDVLAYNTHYNAMLSHMIVNESFLDSAVKRSSVVSLAKAIGYTPRSRRAAEATVNLIVYPPAGYTDTILSITRDTRFQTTIDGQFYTFFPQTGQFSILRNFQGRDLFAFPGLKIKEGRRVSNSFIVNSSNLTGPFTIPNAGVDTSTLRVRVQNSATDFGLTTFTQRDKFIDVKSTTASYYIEEGADGLYQVRFGDGVVGRALEVGNIVIIDYLATVGAPANNARQFSVGQTLTLSTEEVQVQTVQASAGGVARESVDSIKKNAPRYNATKERAVTARDYQSLILAANPNIESVSVWGGEDNDPPIYGKVFLSLNPVSGSIITQSDKDKIQAEIIGPKTPIAIIPEFVDPEFTYVGIQLNVSYNSKETGLTSGQIINLAKDAITNYFSNSLNSLNKHLYYNDLHNELLNISDAVVSLALNYRLQKRITTTDINAVGTYRNTFNAKIQPRTFYSTWFNYELSNNTYKVKVIDVPNADVVAPSYSGMGTLMLEGTDGKRIASIGTIDYDTGKIVFPDLIVKSTYSNENIVRFNVIPHETVKDIKTDILTRNTIVSENPIIPLPSRNTILKLDNTTFNTNTGSQNGMVITTTARVRED